MSVFKCEASSIKKPQNQNSTINLYSTIRGRTNEIFINAVLKADQNGIKSPRLLPPISEYVFSRYPIPKLFA